jgi:glycerol-3-phosphate dehydrogenase (NAD(P)+)
MKTEKISIIGAGSWGTTLAILLAEKGYDISLWSRRKELAYEINNKHENKTYLENIRIPKTVAATSSIKDSIRGSGIIVFVVPSDYLRETARPFSEFIEKDAIVVHAAKGIEKSGRLMSQVLEEELETKKLAVLSGPNHAEEVSRKLPTATVIASNDDKISRILCNVFTTPYFKPYPHHDVKGVEICGTIKNIVAIAIGVCDGLYLGHNAKASILTLGLSEMAAITEKIGAKKATCFGLAGVGDLVATCYSTHSRNRFFGEELARGKAMEQINKDMHGMVAEGVKNTKSVYELCRKHRTETQLISQTYKVLYQNMDLKKAIQQLLDDI